MVRKNHAFGNEQAAHHHRIDGLEMIRIVRVGIGELVFGQIDIDGAKRSTIRSRYLSDLLNETDFVGQYIVPVFDEMFGNIVGEPVTRLDERWQNLA